MFNPFFCNQLATKAQSFPLKSSNESAMIASSPRAKQPEISHEIEATFKFPTPWKTLMIKFPPPWDGKGVKCPGYARGGDVEALI